MRGSFLFKTAVLVLLGGSAITTFAVSFLMNAKNPSVVLLYTRNEKIPDIAFKLSSVPLALSSYIKFGEPRFAAIPATANNIETAIYRGEFVVIGTHGSNGMVVSDDNSLIGPAKVINPKMKNIYFGSCYFGSQRKSWEAMFPNARVIGYEAETDRTTGWRYLFFRSWIDLLSIDFVIPVAAE
jgi:hypothetical protein